MKRVAKSVAWVAGLAMMVWAGDVALGQEAAAGKPTLYLIGDSTVKNGHDTGSGNMWGWGHILPAYFDPAKITVVNDALGGTSSRTFFESPSLWPATLAKVKAGDFVIMQFGTNDNTAKPEEDKTRFRSTLRGNGEETVQGLTKDGTEAVHTYGWYMRQFIAQTEAKGATPIVCSLVPGKAWTNGKVHRVDGTYGLWTQQAVEQANKESEAAGTKGKAYFLPLNKIIADHYDQMGEGAVKALFPTEKEHTHPDWAGAKLNAECVVEGVKGMADCPLGAYLAEKPAAMEAPATEPGK